MATGVIVARLAQGQSSFSLDMVPGDGRLLAIGQ
jgi:hypothetical protein